jgi:hypothetical protein
MKSHLRLHHSAQEASDDKVLDKYPAAIRQAACAAAAAAAAAAARCSVCHVRCPAAATCASRTTASRQACSSHPGC